jgi:hypothetical protein
MSLRHPGGSRMTDRPTFAQFAVRYQLDPIPRHFLAQFRIRQPAKLRLSLRADSIPLRKSRFVQSRMASQLKRATRQPRQSPPPGLLHIPRMMPVSRQKRNAAPGRNQSMKKSFLHRRAISLYAQTPQ